MKILLVILYVFICVLFIFYTGFKTGHYVGNEHRLSDYKEHSDKIYILQQNLTSHENKMMEFHEEMLKINDELEKIKDTIGPYAEKEKE